MPLRRTVFADRVSELSTYYIDRYQFQELVRFVHELESVVVVGSALDYESLRNFTVRLRAADAGAPPLHADALLAVELLDADDQNPAFSHEHYTALIPDDEQKVSSGSWLLYSSPMYHVHSELDRRCLYDFRIRS